jgi:hypothetical protein
VQHSHLVRWRMQRATLARQQLPAQHTARLTGKAHLLVTVYQLQLSQPQHPMVMAAAGQQTMRTQNNLMTKSAQIRSSATSVCSRRLQPCWPAHPPRSSGSSCCPACRLSSRQGPCPASSTGCVAEPLLLSAKVSVVSCATECFELGRPQAPPCAPAQPRISEPPRPISRGGPHLDGNAATLHQCHAVDTHVSPMICRQCSC